MNHQFDHASDSHRSAQLHDLQKSEAERRREAPGRNSRMVERDKPHPELRPTHDQPKRTEFSKAWMREHRDARLEDLARLRAVRNAERNRERTHQYEHERAPGRYPSP